MAETTSIAWTRSTFNPWIGCTEVSTEANGGGGCDGCYARERDKRHRYGGATHWGLGVPRHHTAKKYWEQPLKWNGLAEAEKKSGKIEDGSDWHSPGFWPVFPSMCDPFDDDVPREWHAEFWGLIALTPNLTWLLLTKRITNVRKLLPWPCYFPNVRLGVSVVNQKEADRDVPRLRQLMFASRFISHEPALGEIDWTGGLLEGIDQLITGGESRQGMRKPRPFTIGWARTDMAACRAAGTAFFMKQLGDMPVNREGERHKCKARGGADPAEWPEDLRVQEFPKC